MEDEVTGLLLSGFFFSIFIPQFYLSLAAIIKFTKSMFFTVTYIVDNKGDKLKLSWSSLYGIYRNYHARDNVQTEEKVSSQSADFPYRLSRYLVPQRRSTKGRKCDQHVMEKTMTSNLHIHEAMDEMMLMMILLQSEIQKQGLDNMF